MLHRDLKPANVMIDERGRARIADFGLAGMVDVEPDRERGVIMGTPGYLAPEQFAGQGSSTQLAMGMFFVFFCCGCSYAGRGLRRSSSSRWVRFPRLSPRLNR